MPAQLTIRMDPELVERVQAAARRAGRSTNEHVTIILDAATNPDLAGSEADQLRERLRRAGLLAEVTPRAVPPPDPALVAEARRRAGQGTPLSDIVSEQR